MLVLCASDYQLATPALAASVRQAAVYKERNRDTDWFSITDAEWPALRSAYAAWLDRANFDDAGRQVRTLEQIRAATGR